MASDGRLPLFARLAIRALVPRELRNELEGDLSERFDEVHRASGRRSARRWLRWQLLALRPWRLRRRSEGGARGRIVVDGRMAGGLRADIRQGLRALWLRPGPSLVVVLTVGLAVGATTSVYSVVDGVLLQPLPYPDADRLVRVWQTKESWMESPNSQLRAFANRFPLSVPTFEDWSRSEMGFETLGAYSSRSYVRQVPDGAEVLRGQAVTSGFFRALRIEPRLGRYLTPPDDAPGAGRVVVLSEGLWTDAFGRGDVLGTSLVLDGVAHDVVGVMPAGFQGPEGGARLWTSLSEEEKVDVRDSQYLSVVGRLADGVTLELASERLEAVQAELATAYPDEQGDVGSRVQDLLDSIVGDVRTTLWFLLGTVALVLMVATLNIANVLAVLGLTRRRELAVKVALGAGSGRLMRGLFTESAVLATVGGLVGIAFAWISLPLLLSLVPASVPRYEMIGIRPEIILFGLGVTALTTMLVGTLPAAQAATADPQEVIRSSPRGATAGRRAGRLRSGMVAAEVALAFVLLVAAGLLGNSFARLSSVDRGFAAEGLVLLNVSPDPMAYPESEDRTRFVRELGARFAALPGVAASATNQVPLSGSMSTTTYSAERLEGEPEEINLVISVGLENYLRLMEIPLVSGRGFGAADTRDSAPVAIVNESMAQSVWPDESPLGKRLRSRADRPWVEVVGVARNVQHQGLHIDVEPKMYVPAAQSERSTNHWVLRVRGDLPAAIALARDAVAGQSATTPVRSVQILEETISDSVAVPRFRTYFVVGLAALAGLLALLGVYGVVTFAVDQRTKEIGLRMALGANVERVVRDVVASGVRLAVFGVAVGIAIAWRASSILQEFLFEVTPTDLVTFVTIALGVTFVSAVAAYLPARAAATVDPVSVLNSD